MKARYWKIRKEHKLCASLAGGVPARAGGYRTRYEYEPKMGVDKKGYPAL